MDGRENHDAEVAALVAACEPLQRGDILTREVIQGILGVEPNVHPWTHCVHRAMGLVRQARGIAMWPVVGVGFKLLTESEQVELVPQKRRKKSMNQLHLGARDAQALPTDGLSLHLQRVRVAQLQSLEASERALAEEQAAHAMLSRPTPTNPRLRPGPAPTIPLPEPSPREASDDAGPAESAA